MNQGASRPSVDSFIPKIKPKEEVKDEQPKQDSPKVEEEVKVEEAKAE